MVEHLFCKQAVAGSNPIAGSTSSADDGLQIIFARWCNGSTNDSDSFCLGSTPSGPANCQGTGGIDPPGGRRSRITAVMTDAEFALTIRAVALQLPVSDCGRTPPAIP